MNQKSDDDALQILLVEDNPTDALLLEDALEQVPGVKIKLTLVKRLDEALARLHAEHFDAVLLDLGLPDCTGLETFTRTQSQYPTVPILVLSGLDDETLALTAVQDGAQDYLVKGKLNSAMLARTIRYGIERKRTTERLAESELGYRRLFEAVQDGILILDADTGQITDANPYLEKLLGHSNSEFIGKRLWEISPFRDKQANLVAFRTLQEKGYIRYDDLPLATKDGRQINVEFASNIYGVGDKQVIQCNIRDITERKQVEQELQASEARKSAILETALDCIIGIDAQSRILEWNPASEKTFGYAREEVIGKLLPELIIPESLRAAHFTGMKKYLATGEGPVLDKRIEVPALRKNGEEFPIELAITRHDSGGVPVFTAHLRDITERKQAEVDLQRAKQEAERANLAKSEFLSRMSHELRTPMNAILGFAQLLEMDDLDAEQRQGVEQILKAGRHLLKLINEVLDISRIEAGAMSISLEPVQLSEVLHESWDLVRPLAVQRKVEQRGDWELPGEHYVLADQQRLKQVLLNLLANAIKYNHEGGTVTVSCETRAQDRLCLKITDSGPGIAPEKLEKLFVAFERLGVEHSGVEGTGIGLALSKRLMELMGGEIGVQSTLGEGTTFWIELPRVEGAELKVLSPEKSLTQNSALSTQHSVRTILYIEDNLSNLRLVEIILTRQPHIKLVAAMQGRRGLELAREQRPDLILLDLHLPDMPGDEVLHHLRAKAETRDIPVVMLSADATQHQIERLRAAGARDYLAKPLNVQQFLQVIEQILTKGSR